MDRTLANGELGSGQVSRFTIIDRLGAGAMGVVYRARDTLLKRDVALKLIRPELAEDPRSRSRFVRECQAAAAINHPGIATIYEAGESDEGWLYLASELVHGETLKARVGRGAIQSDEAIDLGIQLAEALAAAHQAGAVHRDIKPGNLMVTPDGRLKVLDFGLARLSARGGPGTEDDATMTRTTAGMVVGTPAYMSPEQAAGQAVDARTDVFAAGCVLYEMLTGTSPFKSSSVPETLRRVLVEEPEPLASSVDQLPPGLEEVLRGALTKDADDRYPSCREMADDLKALRTAEFVPVEVASARRRKRVLAAATGVVAAAVAVVAALIAWNRPGIAFEQRDWLLIASVDNQTGEEVFDLALRTALEADLQQSPYARVMQQSQIRETLQLMRRDPMSPVDEEVGRDICRFADVRAMLLPRILSAGEAYELQAVLVDPVTGDHVDQVRVTARGREAVLLEAIDTLSRSVRRRLGESLGSIRETDLPVARATTSSWEALRYLSLANQKWSEAEFAEAAPLLELAIEADPEFAAAKGTLGLLLIQFLDDAERGRQLLREALVDGEVLPQREYLMIRAVNRQFVDGDLDGALEEYELVCELYPDNMAAHNNRGRILMALGRYDEAAAMFERAAELDPRSGVALQNLWFVYVLHERRARASEVVARKAVALGPEVPGYRAGLAWSLAAQGRFSEAEEELRRVVELDPVHPYAVPNLGLVLFALGAAAEAEPIFRRVYEDLEAGGDSAGRASAAVDLALCLVANGRVGEADTLVMAESRRFRSGSGAASLGGAEFALLSQLAAAVGRTDEARRWLARAEAFAVEEPAGRIELAAAHALIGDEEAALGVLESTYEGYVWDPYHALVMAPFHGLLDEPRFLDLFGVEDIS
jgi:Flp pilus assembly protein TadD/tRNA A-37 threonylcarbamoyl transferase component Bud32